MDFSHPAKKIVELRIATRRACMCEEGDKALISLKTKMLYVISTGGERVTPHDVMERLKILKPNLTSLSKELEKKGLITRTKTLMDRRSITYALTTAGEKYLETRLDRIANNLKDIFGGDMLEAQKKIDQVLELFKLIQ